MVTAHHFVISLLFCQGPSYPKALNKIGDLKLTLQTDLFFISRLMWYYCPVFEIMADDSVSKYSAKAMSRFYFSILFSITMITEISYLV